jgi:hypothetical protein
MLSEQKKSLPNEMKYLFVSMKRFTNSYSFICQMMVDGAAASVCFCLFKVLFIYFGPFDSYLCIPCFKYYFLDFFPL